MKKTILTVAAALAVSGAVLADKLLINGAGATFPFPLYSKWFSQYNKLHPDIQINYKRVTLVYSTHSSASASTRPS